MAGPPTAGFGQVTFLFTGSDLARNRAATTCGFVWPADLNDTYLACLDLWNDLRPATGNGIRLDRIRFKRGPVDTGPTYDQVVGTNGTSTPNTVVSNAAYLVSKQVTGVSGRFRGRMFWPGMPEASVTGAGDIVSAFRTGLQTTFTDWFDAMAAVGSPLRVFSAGSSDPREVSSLYVEERMGTQRRRLRR